MDLVRSVQGLLLGWLILVDLIDELHVFCLWLDGTEVELLDLDLLVKLLGYRLGCGLQLLGWSRRVFGRFLVFL